MQSTSTLEHSVTRDTSPLLPPPSFSQNIPENAGTRETQELISILQEKDKSIFALQSNVENLEKTIELLADAEKAHADKNTVLEAEIARLTSENNILRNQEQILSRMVKEDKQDIDLLRADRKELVQEHERMKREKANLESENAKIWDKIENLEDVIKTHEEKTRKLENEKRELEVKLRDSQQGNGEHYYFKSVEDLKNMNSILKVSFGIAMICLLILAAFTMKR